MTDYEIPLSPKPQSFSVTFPNGVEYQMRLLYQFTFPGDECWILDIADATGDLLLCGVPLVTGADLLAQYAYLGFGATLFVTTDGNIGAVPTWFNLGATAHLWIEG